jgi:hypothetical protein
MIHGALRSSVEELRQIASYQDALSVVAGMCLFAADAMRPLVSLQFCFRSKKGKGYTWTVRALVLTLA